MLWGVWNNISALTPEVRLSKDMRVRVRLSRLFFNNSCSVLDIYNTVCIDLILNITFGCGIVKG